MPAPQRAFRLGGQRHLGHLPRLSDVEQSQLAVESGGQEHCLLRRVPLTALNLVLVVRINVDAAVFANVPHLHCVVGRATDQNTPVERAAMETKDRAGMSLCRGRSGRRGPFFLLGLALRGLPCRLAKHLRGHEGVQPVKVPDLDTMVNQPEGREATLLRCGSATQPFDAERVRAQHHFVVHEHSSLVLVINVHFEITILLLARRRDEDLIVRP
mmetsp:Transcript_107566/g.302832  ORF Transcript_107566/g.302832 Transcript_107566/m.302832 type:complete len:214 (-) Transcript_107566:434-1075(-)